MGRRGSSLKVEITEGAIRVTSGGRCLTLKAAASPPDAEDSPDFLIHLDDIEFWDIPDADQEIVVEDLQRILDAIENECEHHGLSVEFE